tara:strand:- start:3336 stop:3458 length:123 start_codon:yes stop_codon:yes gene_type:complete
MDLLKKISAKKNQIIEAPLSKLLGMRSLNTFIKNEEDKSE